MKLTWKIAAVVGVAAMVVAGCGGEASNGGSSPAASSAPASASAPSVTPGPSTPTATTPSEQLSAMAIARRIRAAVPAVTKLVQITEDNDPNNLLGRPNGYTDAAVIYDKRRQCSSVGVDCGATIEIWPSAADVNSRATYIQGLLKKAPALGTEYDYLNGKALLRISGAMKPSAPRRTLRRSVASCSVVR